MLTTAPHLQVRRPSPTTAEFTVTTCPAPTFSNRLLFSIVFLVRLLLALSGAFLLYSTWPLSSPFHHPDATAAAPEAAAATATTPTALAAPSLLLLHAHNQSAVDDPATGGGQSPTQATTSAVVVVVATTTTTTATAAAAAAASADDDTPPRPTALLTPAWLPYALGQLHASRPGHSVAAAAAAVLPSSLVFPLCLALLYLTTQRIHTTESLLVLRGLGIQTSSTGGSYLASWRAGTRFIPTEKIRDVLINEAFRGFAVRYYLVVVVDGEDDVVVVFPRLLPGRAIVERVWRGVRGCLWEPSQEGGGGGGGGGALLGGASKRWEEKGSNG